MKSNELLRVSQFVSCPRWERVDQVSHQRDKTIQARDTKIKQLEEMITRLHKHAAKFGDQSSTTDKQPANDQNIPSQVSSPPVPDRDGPVKSQFRYAHAWLPSNSDYCSGNPGREQGIGGGEVDKQGAQDSNSHCATPRTRAHRIAPQDCHEAQGKRTCPFDDRRY